MNLTILGLGLGVIQIAMTLFAVTAGINHNYRLAAVFAALGVVAASFNAYNPGEQDGKALFAGSLWVTVLIMAGFIGCELWARGPKFGWLSDGMTHYIDSTVTRVDMPRSVGSHRQR